MYLFDGWGKAVEAEILAIELPFNRAAKARKVAIDSP
jgi:hypothetical protein